MTLIAALEAQDGLVLASDSRGTIGDPRGLTAINDAQKKVFSLSKSCGIAISGASDLANSFVDLLRKRITEHNIVDVDPIVQEVLQWGKGQYVSWFGPRPWAAVAAQGSAIIDQRPPLIFIVCGYNALSDGRCRIYLLNSQLDFAPQLCTTGHMLAGIPQYATYLIHRLYNPQMKLTNVCSLAAYLITETATQDPKVGGPVRIATITPGEGYRDLPETDIQVILNQNEDQNIRLREFFFKGD